MKHFSELEKWVNREINYVLSNPRQRYDKARDEGYVSALKKVQAKIQEENTTKGHVDIEYVVIALFFMIIIYCIFQMKKDGLLG